MKILSAAQIYEADRATMQNLPISSIDLMEKAGAACFNRIAEYFPDRSRQIHVCCGPGNNGGDGLVISRLLFESKFRVNTYLINFSDRRSSDFEINLDRLKKISAPCVDVNKVEELPSISSDDLIVDAIFGIGLKRPAEGLAKEVIQRINASMAGVVSIDFPSGLFASAPLTDPKAVVKADNTLTFQVPKLAFLMPENQDHIHKWEVLDIGLDKNFLKSLETPYEMVDLDMIRAICKVRKKFSHKGTYGHSLLIGGSFGKIGAVVLAARAALKSGSGLVTSYIPKCGYIPMQSAIPEVMVEVDDENYLQFFNYKTIPTAIGVGPGLGRHLKTKHGFVAFFSNCRIPMVIDADGLNIISEFKEISELIPENAVLTPHPKEFERLAGPWDHDYHKLEKLADYSKRHKCVVVLKGAHTAIAGKGKIWFNSSGNTALATAGSGDVLTGIITGLLAQGYSSLDAAILGVFIHGRAADFGIRGQESEETFTAGDISINMGRVYQEIHQTGEDLNFV